MSIISILPICLSYLSYISYLSHLFYLSHPYNLSLLSHQSHLFLLSLLSYIDLIHLIYLILLLFTEIFAAYATSCLLLFYFTVKVQMPLIQSIWGYCPATHSSQHKRQLNNSLLRKSDYGQLNFTYTYYHNIGRHVAYFHVMLRHGAIL